MIRNTDINIQGAEVEVFYSVEDSVLLSCSVKVNGKKSEANWILDIPMIYEDLWAHHYNLLEEENINGL